MAFERAQERGRLGRSGKRLLALGVLLALALIVASTGIALRQLRLDARKHAETMRLLQKVSSSIPEVDRMRWFRDHPEAHPDYRMDRTLRGPVGPAHVLVAFAVESRRSSPHPPAFVPFPTDGGRLVKDAVRDSWGNPLLYRFPGPVHKHGFDVYSTGPNGIDENGEGDNVLVGEDTAE